LSALLGLRETQDSTRWTYRLWEAKAPADSDLARWWSTEVVPVAAHAAVLAAKHEPDPGSTELLAALRAEVLRQPCHTNFIVQVRHHSKTEIVQYDNQAVLTEQQRKQATTRVIRLRRRDIDASYFASPVSPSLTVDFIQQPVAMLDLAFILEPLPLHDLGARLGDAYEDASTRWRISSGDAQGTIRVDFEDLTPEPGRFRFAVVLDEGHLDLPISIDARRSNSTGSVWRSEIVWELYGGGWRPRVALSSHAGQDGALRMRAAFTDEFVPLSRAESSEAARLEILPNTTVQVNRGDTRYYHASAPEKWPPGLLELVSPPWNTPDADGNPSTQSTRTAPAEAQPKVTSWQWIAGGGLAAVALLLVGLRRRRQ